MSRSLMSHLLLLVSALIFGINYWVSKWLTDALPVETIVSLRAIGAGLLFWGLSLFKTAQKVNFRDGLMLAGAGFLGIAINQIFFFSGIKLSNPVDVSIIHVTNPFFVLVLSLIFLKTKISWLRFVGLLFGAAGAIILILRSGQIDFTRQTLYGNLMIIVNTASYAAYLVMSKPLLSRYSIYTVMKWIYLWGAIFTLPYGLNYTLKTDFSTLILTDWISLFYLIVMVTFLAYLFSAFALQNLSTTVVSFYIYLQPLIVAFIAILLGESNIGWYHLIAALFIFAGVYLVSIHRKRGSLPINFD